MIISSRAVRSWRLALLIILSVLAVRWAIEALSDDPEIALEMGGTYEDMRSNSSASFSPLIRGHIWFGIPKTDARLRFIDPLYGFVTPLARFFTVAFNDNVIEDVRMSPQIEPLLIDDALKIVLGLQEQWRARGWVATGLCNNPTIADTPEWRAFLRKGIREGRSFWQAGDKYEAMLLLGRFEDYRNPTEERYLITLELSKPWVSFDAIEARYPCDEPHHFPAPQLN